MYLVRVGKEDKGIFQRDFCMLKETYRILDIEPFSRVLTRRPLSCQRKAVTLCLSKPRQGAVNWKFHFFLYFTLSSHQPS